MDLPVEKVLLDLPSRLSWREGADLIFDRSFLDPFYECSARLSNELDTTSVATSTLRKFLNYTLKGSPRTYDTATITLSPENLSRISFPIPPLEIADLYAGFYEKFGLELLWLIVGGAGARNPLHVDIWSTSTWNLLLAGRKQWVIQKKASSLKFDVMQNPGEIIHIPSGWAHDVTYLEDSIAITQNYVQAGAANEVARHQEAEGLHALSSLTLKLEAIWAQERSLPLP